MIDPRRNSTYERPFTQEGNYLVYIICCIYRYTFVEIKPELKKSILKFGYGINYKNEGMLAHSFIRFYVVTKIILPTVNDINFSKT